LRFPIRAVFFIRLSHTSHTNEQKKSLQIALHGVSIKHKMKLKFAPGLHVPQ